MWPRTDKVYAHTLEGRPPEEWELLRDHAENVAVWAEEYAAAFGAGDWGRLLGLWHDLGKRSDEFQRYIKRSGDPDSGEEESGKPGRVDHSTFGAKHAVAVIGKQQPQLARLLAFCIAGHHGRLPDATADDVNHERSSLESRLGRDVPHVMVTEADCVIVPLKLPFRPASAAEAGFQIAFFTRMLFSSLVDADRTATESFCTPDLAVIRCRAKPGIARLAEALGRFLQSKQSTAPATPVNQKRAIVLADCLAAAAQPPGFFSLTVPTGGGKTLASLAFALNHAVAHDRRRVIVAIPFTSIIEQTADVYRKALGPFADDGLVEHHSNLRPRVDTRNNKLASENWDAPVIVTTNVQLYESLFAAATTPCRKLHRLARSVIVLDEAQTIPVELLAPTIAVLKELVRNYGCTVLLCTATQPALERRAKDFEIGIDRPYPIIRNVPALFTGLKRVRVNRVGRLSDEQLADRLAAEPSVLCIVNTRSHALNVFDLLAVRAGREGCYHLSTMMCAQHRREKLLEIRERLEAGKSCRVVSTQLVEAGVDLDFAVVYRGPCGFDSTAQAAGRCNREGLLEMGQVYLFETETPPPPGLLRSAAQTAAELASKFDDPLTPEAIEAYFRLFYWDQGNAHQWDKSEVMPMLEDDFRSPQLRLKFKTAAARYRIIQDTQQPILVPHDQSARKLIAQLQASTEIDFRLVREAQKYTVGVPERVLSQMYSNTTITPHASGLWILLNPAAYSPDRGLIPEVVGIDPTLLAGV